jgi:hypothetical protein
MSAPHLPRGGDTQDPPASTSPGWLTRLARAAAPQNEQDADGPLRLLQRLSRAQRVIVGAGLLGILFAVAAGGLGDGQSALVRRAYLVAVGLQAVLLMAGALLLWLTVSWRIARFPVVGLIGSFGFAGLFALLFSLSPMATLIGWIVIGLLAVSYIHFWRKGRFGYTRGMSAALFSHIAVICFFVGFPLALVTVLTAADAPVSPWNFLPNSDMSQPTHQATGPPGFEGKRAMTPAPPADWRIVEDGLVEVVADATSPADLRALFDAQWGNVRGHVAQKDAKMWRVRIRCASVPDVPGVDPTLATGRFVVSGTEGTYTVEELRSLADEYSAAGDRAGAEWAGNYAAVLEQAGLAASDDFLLEISDRADCEPLPPPANAVTSDEVIAAAERAGLEVTNPRDATTLCHELGCLRRTTADEVTIIMWPTAEAARDWLRGPTVNGVLFAPVTTAQLNGELASAGAPPFGSEEGQRYKDGLVSAATVLEQAR